MASEFQNIAEKLFLVFNALFASIGLALVFIGANGLMYSKTSSDIVYLNISNHFFITGCVIVACMAMLCSFGAFYRKANVMVVYSVVLILASAQLIPIVQNLNGRLHKVKASKKFLTNTLTGNKPCLFVPIGLYEEVFSCCGLDSAMDYIENGATIPSTCCPEKVSDCTADHAFKQGCFQSILWITSATRNVVGLIAVLTFVSAILGFYLANEISPLGWEPILTRLRRR